MQFTINVIRLFHFNRGSSSGKGFGQVITQSYGIWHTKCFPRDSPPNATEVADICRKLGYKNQVHPEYKLLTQQDLEEFSKKYREATKTEIATMFSTTKLNGQYMVVLKRDKPIAKLVKWDKSDMDNCYRLEIKCD